MREVQAQLDRTMRPYREIQAALVAVIVPYRSHRISPEERAVTAPLEKGEAEEQIGTTLQAEAENQRDDTKPLEGPTPQPDDKPQE